MHSLDRAIVDRNANDNLFVAVFHPNITVAGHSDCILVQLRKTKCVQLAISTTTTTTTKTHTLIQLTVLLINWHSVAKSVNSFWVACLISTNFDSAAATRSVISRFNLSNFCASRISDRRFDCFRLLITANSNDSIDPSINFISTVDSPVQFASNTR